MPDSPADQPLADLVGHHAELVTACSCTRVVVMRIDGVVQRFGQGATIRSVAGRLRCKDCGERPRLALDLEWSISEGRDRRQHRPALPEWARDAMGKLLP